METAGTGSAIDYNTPYSEMLAFLCLTWKAGRVLGTDNSLGSGILSFLFIQAQQTKADLFRDGAATIVMMMMMMIMMTR